MNPRRAFVVGAFLPNGGTFMAYHLGRILQLDFGFEAIAVKIGSETADTGVQRYDPIFPQMTIAQMEAAIGADDVLICNPSFSSHTFGLRLPGRKISYVQHFNTFTLLDCRLDHYVAVSDVVSRFLSAIYGLTTRIIPPFIDIDRFPAASVWQSRPAGSTLVFFKSDTTSVDPFLHRLKSILSSRAPDIGLDDLDLLPETAVPQPELLRRIGEHRHLLVLTAAEGFGLVPLEAMAMGTTVIGFDGYGGRDYMRPGVNCAVAPYPDIESVAEHLIAVTRAPDLGAKLARGGRVTAEQYTYARFRSAWIEEFSRVLEMEPVALKLENGSV